MQAPKTSLNANSAWISASPADAQGVSTWVVLNCYEVRITERTIHQYDGTPIQSIDLHLD